MKTTPETAKHTPETITLGWQKHEMIMVDGKQYSAGDLALRVNSHDALVTACEHALKETACAFNPHDESEDLIVSMGRTSIQLLHNHLKAALAAAQPKP